MTRRKETAVSNEEIIAALLSNGTIAKAAEACGISAHTIYDRMRQREFQALYYSAKSDIIRGAVFDLNTQLTEAVKVIGEIVTNKENNPAVRLQAAQTIINNASKLSATLVETEHKANQFRRPPFELDIDTI